MARRSDELGWVSGEIGDINGDDDVERLADDSLTVRDTNQTAT
jgi:hypothetical protein